MRDPNHLDAEDFNLFKDELINVLFGPTPKTRERQFRELCAMPDQLRTIATKIEKALIPKTPVTVTCRRCEQNQTGVRQFWGSDTLKNQHLYAHMGLCYNCATNDETANYSVVRNMKKNLLLSKFDLYNIKSISRDYRSIEGLDGRLIIDGIELH